MADEFQYGKHVTHPSRAPYTVTPSDTVELTIIPKALYVGVAGDVTLVGVDSPDDTPIPFYNVPAGSILDVQPKLVMATGTDADGIVALA